LSYGRPPRSRATRKQTTGAPAPREIAGERVDGPPGALRDAIRSAKTHHRDEQRFRRSCKNFQAFAAL